MTDLVPSLRDIQSRFVVLIGDLIGFATACGYEFTFGDADCQTGHMANSLHYQRLAIDLNLFVDSDWIKTASPAWDRLGDYWKSLDPLCRWGGDIVEKQDYNHFSMVPNATDNRI